MSELEAGAFIERMRTKEGPPLTVRAAAREAGISESRWRQIVSGYRQETAELRVPVRAPARTLARMARVVGSTPEQLREVGRDDAADELVRLCAEPATPPKNAQTQGQETTVDVAVEFAAMEQVAAVIGDLDPEARRRVLNWALDRYVDSPSLHPGSPRLTSTAARPDLTEFAPAVDDQQGMHH